MLKRYTIDLEFFLKDPDWDVLEYGVALSRREEILKRKHQIPKKYLQKIQALENQFLEKYGKRRVEYTDEAVKGMLNLFLEEIKRHPF